MNEYLMANAALSKFCRNYMRLKKNLPIRPSEMGVLNIIVETEGPHTPLQLAKLLGVSKPMITAHITTLGKLGYITREQSREDKRMFFVLPTKQAVELVESAKAEMEEQLKAIIEQLGRDDFDQLVCLIGKANHILEADDAQDKRA